MKKRMEENDKMEKEVQDRKKDCFKSVKIPHTDATVLFPCQSVTITLAFNH